jgi:hypothetical protein
MRVDKSRLPTTAISERKRMIRQAGRVWVTRGRFRTWVMMAQG